MNIAIICYLDAVANSVRAKEIETFLLKRGHSVTLIDTYSWNFGTKLEKIWSYRLAKARCLITKQDYMHRIEQIKLKSRVLEKEIKQGRYDVLICELFSDAYVLTKNLRCLKIWDCPTPYSAELREAHNIPSKEIDAIEVLEREILQAADYVCFHWDTYTDFMRRSGYKGSNLFTLNWGCHPKKNRATFKYPPKVVYLGNLAGSWINKSLLRHLVQIGGNVDVFGTPVPEDPKSLNYKGYAPSIDILRNYQFGLVTVDRNDKLHCNGFSAKQLEYISYGLPVLVPEWRDIPNLNSTSIPYNEENFLQQVTKYSEKEEWQRMSDIAYEQAKKLDWNITLEPLAKIIGEYAKNPKK